MGAFRRHELASAGSGLAIRIAALSQEDASAPELENAVGLPRSQA